MPQAVDCDLFLYADDTCLIFQDKDQERMKEELTNFFSNIFDWLIDIKLNIHFGDDKTKIYPFLHQKQKKGNCNFGLTHYDDVKIRQNSKVSCELDEILSEKAMALKVVCKSGGRLKFH